MICKVVLYAPQVRELYLLLRGGVACAGVTVTRWVSWPWMTVTAIATVQYARKMGSQASNLFQSRC